MLRSLDLVVAPPVIAEARFCLRPRKLPRAARRLPYPGGCCISFFQSARSRCSQRFDINQQIIPTVRTVNGNVVINHVYEIVYAGD